MPLWLAPSQSAGTSQRAFRRHSGAPLLFPFRIPISIGAHWQCTSSVCDWFFFSLQLLSSKSSIVTRLPAWVVGGRAFTLLPRCWLGWRANENAFWRVDGGVNSESAWFYHNEHIEGGQGGETTSTSLGVGGIVGEEKKSTFKPFVDRNGHHSSPFRTLVLFCPSLCSRCQIVIDLNTHQTSSPLCTLIQQEQSQCLNSYGAFLQKDHVWEL